MEKKNTILLTVIAIATLLVAMVGATFAYFTAQRGQGAQADIKVTTSTSDSIVYSSFNPLTVKATQQNFNETDKHSQRGSTEGTITLTASDNEDRLDTADYCYTSTLKVSKNTFIYKPKAEDSPEEVPAENKPELLLTISIDDQNYTQEIGDLTYTTIEGPNKVCDQVDGEIPEDESCDEETLAGYDLTEFGKDSTPGEEPLTPTVDLKIPVKDQSEETLNNLLYVHHISSEETGGSKTVKWKATITFINYDFDQQYNTDHQFLATWVFTPANCETGEAIEITP